MWSLRTGFIFFKSGSGEQNGYSYVPGRSDYFGGKTSDYITTAINTQRGNMGYISPMIDLTRYTTAYLDATITVIAASGNDEGTYRPNGGFGLRIYVGSDAVTTHYLFGDVVATSSPLKTANVRTTLSVDISSITQELYIKIDSFAVIANLYNIWLE